MNNRTERAVDALMESNGLEVAGSMSDAPDRQSDDEEVKQVYTQYINQGNTLTPSGPVALVDSLPSVGYKAEMTFHGPVFTKVRMKTDELLTFSSSPMERVVEEIDKFWSLKDNFTRLGFMHNRGVLVYGPPGTGKSCMVQQVVEMMTKRGDVVFFSQSPSGLKECLKAFRDVEPDRRVVVVIEDIDECIRYDEGPLLHLLDGDSQVDNVCYLATTNYVDKLPPRVLRPGRFDKKVLVGPPTTEVRKRYLASKLKGVVEDDVLDSLAEKTKGLSFGHLRELVIGAYAFNEPVDETIARLKKTEFSELEERKGKTVIEEGRVVFLRIEIPDEEEMEAVEKWQKEQLWETRGKRLKEQLCELKKMEDPRLRCPECGSTNIISDPKGIEGQDYVCKRCGYSAWKDEFSRVQNPVPQDKVEARGEYDDLADEYLDSEQRMIARRIFDSVGEAAAEEYLETQGFSYGDARAVVRAFKSGSREESSTCQEIERSVDRVLASQQKEK